MLLKNICLLCNFIKHLIALILLINISACSSTQKVVIKAVEPSPVNLANDIKNVGVINNSQSISAISKGLSLNQQVERQDNWLRKKGATAALQSLVQELKKDERFTEVMLLSDVSVEQAGFLNDDATVKWHEIESICDENKLDILFSLAHYDMGSKVSLKKSKIASQNMMRDKTQINGQEITLETLVENGWKIYYPKYQLIIDEFTYNEEFVSKAKGINPAEALKAMQFRRDSIIQKGKLAGNTYGKRLQPFERDIYRTYFVKGSEGFQEAGELMQAGDITDAQRLWFLGLKNDKAKIRARACHNLAVSSEFQGNLEEALEWALKAKNNHANKDSEMYVSELENRITKENLLKAQQFSIVKLSR